MEELNAIIGQYGYIGIALWVFFDQLGIPIPGIPLLVFAGALAGEGQLSLTAAVLASTAGALPSDFIWFETGRRRGARVLKFVCQLSLEPDSCVRGTEKIFERFGPWSLLIAKFVPGYQTVAPPLAAISGMSRVRFLLFDLPGAFLWSLTFMGIGYLLHEQMNALFVFGSKLGSLLGYAIGGTLLLYVGWKFYHRQRLIRSLRVARIEPEELKQLLDSGEPVAIVDLRSRLEIEFHGQKIPGALTIGVEALSDRHAELPRDREVVLYCT
jgi:membrane protein DedA with SNARE-associated domain